MFFRIFRMVFNVGSKKTSNNLGRWGNVGSYKKENQCITSKSGRSYAYDCAKEFDSLYNKWGYGTKL